MTAEAIHALLRERFGEAVAEFEAPEAGDPSITVAAERLHEICVFLRNDPKLRFDYLQLITGVDWAERIGVVYHLFSYEHQHSIVVKVDLDRGAPKVASIVDVWPAADWHEREAWDMMGIEFEGHPDLRRILLPEDWEGHPLRKDYTPPKEYHGITNE